MRFTVQWDAQLEADFTFQWTRASSESRAFFTSVAQWIDSELAIGADLKGFAIDENARAISTVTSRGRIVIEYQVLLDDRTVRVLRIKYAFHT